MQLGQINKLAVSRITPPGAYLKDFRGDEVLLPRKYLIPENDFQVGALVDVFVFKDSQNRIVSTTESPHLLLGNIAFLKVVLVNMFGAFVDWGLDKNLFVPFKEQAEKMEEGRSYLITLRYDNQTDRLFGSSKITKTLEPCRESLEECQVSGLVWSTTELGVKIIVNQRYEGLIFKNDVNRKLECGDEIICYVRKVRTDGKLDLQFDALGLEKYDNAYSVLLERLTKKKEIFLHDKSSPEEINKALGMSKKLFKQTVGKLLKNQLITLTDKSIRLK
ncbi:MAG: RNA-binding protein [Bacteroidetes bacterium]|nr:RNA-binding protein [Bacteroidota bacterium]